MKQLNGIAASSGIAIGKTFVYRQDDYCILKHTISKQQISSEIKRFRDAMSKTRQELLSLKKKIVLEIGKEHADIFLAHLQILEDPLLVDDSIKEMKTNLWNIEYAFTQAVAKLVHMISSLDDPIFRERVDDVRDVARRVLKHMIGKERETLADLNEQVVVIAPDLTPSDTAIMRKNKILAFATDAGGRTSHTTIMARALGIPAVVSLKQITEIATDNDIVIVDGNSGIIIVNPDEETLNKYKQEQQLLLDRERELEKLRDIQSKTKDDEYIELSANIEIPEEINLLRKHGINSVGLYRTEFLYMNRNDLPSEEEQFAVYKTVLEQVKPHSVIIRTLDLGGDKFISSMGEHELNPFRGLRAIRFCLARPDIFKTQLRALLKASNFGELKIMFPLITTIEEIRKTKLILEEAKSELVREQGSFSPSIKIGIMIEVPSAALLAEQIAKEVDFFSIGTNDLFQYLFAVDRANENVANLYDDFQPALIRVIKQVVDAANNAKINVEMCGEMAGDPSATVLLIGLGLTNLSMTPSAVPEVKKCILGTTVKEARTIAERALNANTAEEVNKILNYKKKC